MARVRVTAALGGTTMSHSPATTEVGNGDRPESADHGGKLLQQSPLLDHERTGTAAQRAPVLPRRPVAGQDRSQPVAGGRRGVADEVPDEG